MTFLHYKVNDNSEFLHLHLIGYHYTPYLPATVNSVHQLEQNISLVGNSNEPVSSEPYTTPGIMTRYLVGESIGIIRDLGIFSVNEWSIFIEQCNKAFQGMELTVVLFRNNLPVPKVENRYRIIKEYHESTIGGHKGITKTYDKLAHEY